MRTQEEPKPYDGFMEWERDVLLQLAIIEEQKQVDKNQLQLNLEEN